MAGTGLLTVGSQEAERTELFNLQRLDAAGEVYRGSGDIEAEPSACVFDRNTGLTWEVKTSGEGLHAADNTYTWHEPDNERLIERERGSPDGGQCSGSDCDTAAFVQAVNSKRLCGYSDWRLPEIGELTTLNDPGIEPPGPTIPLAYFPNAKPAGYWSSTSYRFHYAGAWLWDFKYGFDRVDWKSSPQHVRLVRGELNPELRRAPD